MDSLLLGFLVLLPALPPLVVLAVVWHGPFPNRWWRGERVWGVALSTPAIANRCDGRKCRIA
jgi:hypothetical protein